MKNLRISLISCGLVMLIATACSSEITDEQTVEVPKNGNFLQLDLKKSCDSRYSTDDTSFSEGDEVLVIYLLGINDKNNDGSVTFPDERIEYHSKAIYLGGKWVFENPIDLDKVYVPDITVPYNRIYVVYPYIDFSGFDNSAAEGIDIKDFTCETDYLAGMNNNIIPENNLARITMNHLTARITLKIYNPTDYDAHLSSLIVKNAGNKFYSVEDGKEYAALEWFYNNTRIRFSGNPDLYIKFESYYHFEKAQATILVDKVVRAKETAELNLVLPPTNWTYLTWEKNKAGFSEFSGIRMLLNCNDKEYTIEFTPDWEAGQRYIYPVTLPESLSKSK